MDIYAGTLFKSLGPSEAESVSPPEADATTAGPWHEVLTSSEQANKHSQAAAPHDAGPVATPTSERTAPRPSGKADASPVEKAPLSESISSGLVSDSLMVEPAPGMEAALKQGVDVADADTPAAGQVHPAAPLGQPDSASPGPTAAQLDSIAQFGKEEESDTPSEGAADAQLDSAEQTSEDGVDACPQAARMSDQETPLVAGEAIAEEVPAIRSAQPDTAPSNGLSSSTEAKPCIGSSVLEADCSDGSAIVADAFDGSVQEADRPDGSVVETVSHDDGVVEADAPEAEAEDSSQPLGHPLHHTSTAIINSGVTLDAASLNSLGKGSVAADSASGSGQLQVETAANASPLQPAQKLPVSSPAALGAVCLGPAAAAPDPAAPIPAALSATASDERDTFHDGAVSGSQAHEQDGWGAAAQAVQFTAAGAPASEDGWGEAAKAVDEPSFGISVEGVGASSMSKKKRRRKKKSKVSCTAQPLVLRPAGP